MTMDEVYCPYCGSEMEIEWDDFDFCAYTCPNCNSKAPRGDSIENAEKKALQRPPQKLLTLEEAMDGKEPGVCVEHKVPRCIYYAFVSDSEFEGMCNIESIGRSTPCIARIADYGKEWRCWATKPTDEEREAAKWED